MTRYLGTDSKVHILWDSEAEPVDWATPNVGDGIDDEYCGNCGWDAPGCGCPRDPHYDGTDVKLLPVQKRDDPPLPWPKPAPDSAEGSQS
jgi:hypothetical protein